MTTCQKILAIAGISHLENGIRINGAVFEIAVPEGGFFKSGLMPEMPGRWIACRFAPADPIAGYFSPRQERILRWLLP